MKEWQQHELSDGTYDISDLLDWHEMDDVRTENEIRYQAATKINSENGGR